MGNTDSDKTKEEAVKKLEEQGRKKAEEEQSKVYDEERSKKVNAQNSKVTMEEKAKQFEDDLRVKQEQHKKAVCSLEKVGMCILGGLSHHVRSFSPCRQFQYSLSTHIIMFPRTLLIRTG